MAPCSTRSTAMGRDRRNRLLVPTKPRSLLNSIFVSTATAASKMLSSAAAASSAAEDDQFVRAEGLICPRGLESSSSSSLSEIVLYGGVESGGGGGAESTPIGRALTHVLEILNATPATSRKYEQLLAMADRLVADNLLEPAAAAGSHPSSLVIATRCALSSAFSRTSALLRRSLRPHPDEQQQHCRPLASFLSRLLPRALRDALRGAPAATAGTTCAADAGAVKEEVEAEKLAWELLWTAERCARAGPPGRPSRAGPSNSALASLALAAHPRLQAPILTITGP